MGEEFRASMFNLAGLLEDNRSSDPSQIPQYTLERSHRESLHRHLAPRSAYKESSLIEVHSRRL